MPEVEVRVSTLHAGTTDTAADMRGHWWGQCFRQLIKHLGLVTGAHEPFTEEREEGNMNVRETAAGKRKSQRSQTQGATAYRPLRRPVYHYTHSHWVMEEWTEEWIEYSDRWHDHPPEIHHWNMTFLQKAPSDWSQIESTFLIRRGWRQKLSNCSLTIYLFSLGYALSLSSLVCVILAQKIERKIELEGHRRAGIHP